MAYSGVVRFFTAEEGWGVIDGPDVPGGCWVHFSTIASEGFRALMAGEAVSFRAEAATQDGFAFRALRVWRSGPEPTPPPGNYSVAYQSLLSLTFDEPDPA